MNLEMLLKFLYDTIIADTCIKLHKVLLLHSTALSPVERS